MSRVSVSALVGPLSLAAGIWCAAGDLTLASAAETTVRIAIPASWWWFVAGAAVGAAAKPCRRHPILSTPALLSVIPWLPIPLPAGLLLWTGRLAWMPVLLALLACGLAHVLPDRPDGSPRPAKPASPRTHALVAAAFTLVMAIATAWSLAPRLPGGDEPHYLVIAQSLLKDGDLQVENNHAARDYAPYFSGDLAPHYIQRGKNGQIYSIHAPGLGALVAPLFALFGYRGAQATVLFLAAATGSMIWIAGWMATRRVGAAWFAWAALTGSATFAIQSVTIFPDGPAAFVVAASVFVLLRLTEGKNVRPWSVVGLSGLLALLPFLHTRFVVLSAAIGLSVVWLLATTGDARGRVKQIARFMIVPVVAGIGWLAYFQIIYGTPNPVIPYGREPGTTLTYVPGGIAGLFFDQQFGLFTYTPVLMVALGGWLAWLRDPGRKDARWLLPATGVIYLVAVGTYWMWWAGVPATPARFSTAILPLFAAPLAIAWQRGQVMSRALLAILLATSLGVTTMIVGVQRGALAWNGRDGHAAWLGWFEAAVNLPRAWPSFFWDLVPGVVASERPFAVHVISWCLAFALAAVVLALAARVWGRDRGAVVVACAAWCLPLGLMAAAHIGWRLSGVGALEPSRSQAAALMAASQGVSIRRIETGRIMLVAPGEWIRLTVPRADLRGSPTMEWMSVGGLPAGRYEIVVSSAREPGGTLRIAVQGDAPEVQTFTLDREHSRFTMDLRGTRNQLRIDADPRLQASSPSIDVVPQAIGRK